MNVKKQGELLEFHLIDITDLAEVRRKEEALGELFQAVPAPLFRNPKIQRGSEGFYAAWALKVLSVVAHGIDEEYCHPALAALKRQLISVDITDQPSVNAAIIAVKGSAPRESGTQHMQQCANSGKDGYTIRLSGYGEANLFYRACWCFVTGKPREAISTVDNAIFTKRLYDAARTLEERALTATQPSAKLLTKA